MANFAAITSVTKAIIKLFEGEYPKDLLGAVNFLAVNGTDLAETLRATVTVCLYRFEVNSSGRTNQQFGNSIKNRTPPLPLDLFYIVTPWISNPDRQQRILGWLLQILHDNPIVPSQYLNAEMENPSFNTSESVGLECESVNLQEFFSFYESFKVRFPASVLLVAKNIMIDSTMELSGGKLVGTNSFPLGVYA